MSAPQREHNPWLYETVILYEQVSKTRREIESGGWEELEPVDRTSLMATYSEELPRVPELGNLGMLCCHCLEILTIFLNKRPLFLFCPVPHT